MPASTTTSDSSNGSSTSDASDVRDVPDADAMPEAVEKAARQAFESLRRLQRAALTACGYPLSAAPPDGLVLPWNPGLDAAAFGAAVYEQARRLASAADVVQPGRVYCFDCGTSVCAHATVPDAEAVFAGYGNRGTPVWQALPNFLLAAGDTRLDRLYAAQPQVLARVVGRKSLIDAQFETFGRNSLTYRVVGEVVAGFLPTAAGRFALTVQIVETARHDLVLQVLAAPALLDAVEQALDTPTHPLGRVHDALRDLRTKLAILAVAWRSERGRTERKELQVQVFGLLKHLAGNLERHDRQHRRRTGHAVERATQQRPVAKAIEDVQSAGPDHFFRDRKTQSIVVLGRRGRSHIFSNNGRHITSLALPGDLLERRKSKQRYVPLPPSDIATFKAALGQSA